MTAKQARAKAPLEMPSQLDYAAYRRDIEARWKHRCTCGHDPCRPEYHYSDRTRTRRGRGSRTGRGACTRAWCALRTTRATCRWACGGCGAGCGRDAPR